MAKELCFYCSVPMKKTFTSYRGIKLEVFQCPKCKKRIFTEEQADKAARAIDAQRVKKQYIKHPIKIGHSWGFTFPKDLAEVFDLNKKTTELTIKPLINKKIIQIKVS